MADGLSLAASVAGLVSLGLQVTQGIVSYVDALESRQEELRSVKQQNDALSSALAVIRSAASRLQQEHQSAAAAVSRNLLVCTENLEVVKKLLAELAHCDTSTWWKRVKSQKKKLAYAFDRPKLQALAQRLKDANSALQLALAGLGLDISLLHTDKLTTIESSSRDASSQLHLVRSEVAAVGTTVAEVHNQSHTLNSSVEAVSQLVVAHSEANATLYREATAGIRHEVRQTQQVQASMNQQQLRELKEIKALMKQFQRATKQRHPPEVEFARLVTTPPATLQGVCDGIGLRYRNNHRALGHTESSGGRERDLTEQSLSLSPDHATEFGCTCSRRGTTTAARGYWTWGHAFLSTETSTRGHWPDCPFANTASTKHRKASMQYFGLARILKSAIGVSFSMTAGAGGFSISPSFTFRPTVDANLNPALKIMKLLCCLPQYPTVNNGLIFNAYISRIQKMILERKVYPGVVDERNRTLMHHATELLCSPYIDFEAVKLTKLLLSAGVPASSYDLMGRSPLFSFLRFIPDEPTSRTPEDSLLLLAREFDDHQPVVLEQNPMFGVDSRLLSIYRWPPSISQVFSGGPLGSAVCANNPTQVEHLVTRFPGMLEELDCNGKGPLFLAVDKPDCFKILLAASKPLPSGRAACDLLQAALWASFRLCINGIGKRKCRRCPCAHSLAILLKNCFDPSFTKELAIYLEQASERARRRFVCHIARLRIPTSGTVGSQALGHTEHQTEQQHLSQVYSVLQAPSTAELWYRHGLRPGPNFPVGLDLAGPDYVWWLIGHGVDLGLRSLEVPLVADVSSPLGVCGAHHAFYNLGRYLRWQNPGVYEESERQAFAEIVAIVLPYAHTDGCRCHCSVAGCSPLTWMMKAGWGHLDMLRYFFECCGPEHTSLAFHAAIRFATFQRLGLNHTCCDPWPIVVGSKQWVERDDVHAINDEQECLLSLHEKLVRDFEEEAARITEETFDERSILVDFWDSYWRLRMEEELAKLNGAELTEDERRGAEDVGVRWCEPVEVRWCEPVEVVEVKENPFPEGTQAHWFYKLDSICPEYKEPWPKEVLEEWETVRDMSDDEFHQWRWESKP